MTVKELYDELGNYIDMGHADTQVIADCKFTITKGNGDYDGFHLMHLNNVYYQSGDIELGFSQEADDD